MPTLCEDIRSVVQTHADQRSAFSLINLWRAHETFVNEVLTMSACVYSYRNLATEHETLMQKYLHLLQIVETEKTVAKQLRQQIEDGEIEIERLKSEVSCFVILCCLCVCVRECVSVFYSRTLLYSFIF